MNGLSLGFVYGNGPGISNWKLMATQYKWQVRVARAIAADARDNFNVAAERTNYDADSE